MGMHLREYSLSELNSLLDRGGFRCLEARMWNGGRLRHPTKWRRSYVLVKRVAEPILGRVPVRLRVRAMSILDYSCVVARP
jgi:hypothetical protein